MADYSTGTPPDGIEDEMEAAALVVADCPNCWSTVAMYPKIGGEDPTMFTYKKGSRECPECGKLIFASLTVGVSQRD